MTRKIFLDMDDVLCDFEARSTRLLGKKMKDFPKSSDAWDALGDYKFNFYALLDPMPDAHTLVEGVMSLAADYGYPVGVLTALPRSNCVPLAEEHKKFWLGKHFPELLTDFNIGPYAVDKQNHCKPGYILIDDSPLNIPQWNVKGGKGILHTSAKTSLLELRTHLESLELVTS